MKTCPGCKQTLPLEMFHSNKAREDGRAWGCKECMNATHRAWRAKNPRDHTEEYKTYNRGYQIKHKFGITAEEYDAMLEAQGGVCAICSTPPGHRRLAVDHDHSTLEVRGLLCKNCNTGLGLFQDQEALLLLAATYVKKARIR